MGYDLTHNLREGLADGVAQWDTSNFHVTERLTVSWIVGMAVVAVGMTRIGVAVSVDWPEL